jgi:hypothetical protein
MKKTIFSALIITLIIASCVRKENTFPQGAWQIVQTQSVVDGKKEVTYPVPARTLSEFKMWSEKNFMFVGVWNEDTLRGDNYGGGTYTIEENQYVETVMYHYNKAYIGKILKMTLELRNDTLIQIYQPVDSTGRLIENRSSVEKFIRLR